jgi:hypothetical protein
MTTPRGGDPEEVLSQALRAMAGGRRTEPVSSGNAGGAAAPTRRSWWSRLTVLQLFLIAAIVGLTVGMIAGIVVLLTR